MNPNSRTYTANPETMSVFLKRIWQYRKLLYFFVWRLFKVRYKQTYLGIVWALVKPVLPGVMFASLFALGGRQSGTQDFSIIYFGYLLWYVFQAGLVDAINSYEYDRSVVTRVYMPKSIIPLSHILFRAIDSLIAFGVSYFVYLVLHPVGLTFMFVVQYIIALIFLSLSASAVSMFLSPIHIRFRDVGIIATFAIQVGFFLSPLFIGPDSSLILRGMSTLNPFSVAVLYITDSINALQVSVFFIACLIFLVFGLFFFKNYSNEYFEML